MDSVSWELITLHCSMLDTSAECEPFGIFLDHEHDSESLTFHRENSQTPLYFVTRLIVCPNWDVQDFFGWKIY